MILRNKGHAVIGIFVRILAVIAGRVTPNFVRVIKQTLAKMSALAHHQGVPGLVKYLKVCGISLNQAIAGYKSVHTPRVSTTNAGLPRLLPVQLRRLIRAGHTVSMRLANTLLSLFRDLEYKSEPKWSSIVSPFTGNKHKMDQLAYYIPRFTKLFVLSRLPEGATSLRDVASTKFTYFPIYKSGPYTLGNNACMRLFKASLQLITTHPIIMIRSALGLEENILESLKVLSDIYSYETINPITMILAIRTYFDGKLERWWPFNVEGIPSGKLGLKQEAAGKMRVFAMVDPWSQWILRPIHKAIFSVLRKHSMDGTFNQLKPLRKAWAFPALFSMDLTAATDRLPLSLQVKLLKSVFCMTDREAQAWADVMVGRRYRLPSGYHHKGNPWVTYTVGQPMGALSSWAMLALTHHFIVQCAAWQVAAVGPNTLFKAYAVLGDDIVIFDSRVAKRYHAIMLSLGVECNLTKSIISKDGIMMEFAKRIFFKGIDISPTPLKELHAALENIVAFYSYITKYKLSWPIALRVAGFGYRVFGSVQTKPFNKLNLKVRYLMFVGLITDPQAVLDSLLNLRRHLSAEHFNHLFERFVQEIYLGLLKSYDKTRQRAQRAFAFSATSWSDSVVPHLSLVCEGAGLNSKEITFYNEIFWVVYKPMLQQVIFDLMEAGNKLDRIFYDRDLRGVPALDQAKALVDMIQIDAKASPLTANPLNVTKTELVSSNPVVVKMFKIHKAFTKVVSNSKELLRPADVAAEPLQSGFVPLSALRLLPRILPKALNRANITSIILAGLRRRIGWTVGFTGILGIASYFQGLPTVIGILLTI
jgi:hypothetical protein